MACLGIFSMLAAMAQPALAGQQLLPTPAARHVETARGAAAEAAAPARDLFLDRVAPVAAEWQQQTGASRSAAALFDGDAATSLRTENEAAVRVALPGPRRMGAVGIHGRANGWLSVSTLDGAGRETAVPGLQNLDLRALPLRWNRFRAPQPAAAASVLMLRWRPNGPGASLGELELFGFGGAPRRTGGAALADRIVSAPPADAIEAWSDLEELGVSAVEVGLDSAAAFKIGLPIDPRLVQRAFLVYELGGLPHWSAAVRQVNGFSTLGGHAADAVSASAGGVQVEEISPEWLFRGDNEIRFLPVSDPDAPGYRVRHVRLVLIPGAGTPAAADVAAPAASGDLPRLTDGDPATGIRGRQGKSFLTLPLAAGAQPASLSLRVEERLSGRLQVTTLRPDGHKAPAQELDVAGLEPGWHTLPLDRLATGQALRVTWDPGREGGGLISEARLSASPEPQGRGRKLAVSYPLHGECVDHQVYVRGFLNGTSGEPARPQFWFGGVAIRDGLAADGAFALTADEPAEVRGRPWSIALRARFADGTEVSETIPVDTCGDRPLLARPARRPGEPLPLVEDEGAPFGKRVAAAKGDVLEMGGARLQIPAGALERDTRVTIRPLVDSQVARFDDPLMENVTPERGAFRMGPHNLKFKQPVRISLPYDRALVRKGLEPGELGIFYFDEELGRWQRLPSAAIASRGVLVAETTHFTDFMVATLPQPESPSASLNTPNMLGDIKAGDPTSGITMIQPPGANSDGSAHLSFPIEVVPGRNGMQPALAIQYDSGAGNGLLGVGWSLPLSNIQVDTKFGTPTFRTENSQRFLLDGDELVPDQNNTVGPDSRLYRRRVERGFARLVRQDTWGEGWQVTDRNGLLYQYGVPRQGTNAARISADSDDEHPVYWGLSRVTDPLGNAVEYNYTRTTGGPGADDTSNWQELLPSTILYTSFFDSTGVTRQDAGLFRVSFVYEDRPDPFSNAKLGREIRSTKRLKTVRSEYFNLATSTWTTFRSHDFTYTTGEFGKSLLKTITSSSGATVFYKHDFEYQKLPRDAQSRVQFGPAQVWATLPAGDTGALGKGKASSLGIAGFGGVGPVSCYPHVGAGMSGGGGDESAQEAFVDINGDGLPDIVRGSGQTYLNKFASSGGVVNRNLGTFTSLTTTPFGTVSAGKSSSRTYSLGLHFPGEMGGNLATTSSRSSETRGLVDINGDGLPDLFNGVSYECNNFPGSTCNGSSSSTLPFGAPVSWGGGDTSGYTYMSEPADAGGSSFSTQMVLRWTAPFDGTVTVDGGARRNNIVPPPPPPPAPYNPPPHDPVTALVYSRTYNPSTSLVAKVLLWQRTFSAGDMSQCFPARPPRGPNTACNSSTGLVNQAVKAGDEYYFVVSTPGGNQRNTLVWSPSVTYTNVTCPDPANKNTCLTTQKEPFGPFVYDYDLTDDLRLAGAPAVPWVSGSGDTKPNGTRSTATTVRITGSIIKTQATSDNVRFQVVRLRTGAAPVVVWPSSGVPMQMTAAQITAFNFDPANVVVDVMGKWVVKGSGAESQWTVDGDQLVFQVLTDAPIDPQAITWKPVVTYQNYCYPDPVEQQRLYLASNPRVTPSPNSVPFICTNSPATVMGNASQAVEVQFPAFRYKPAKPSATNTSLPLPNATFMTWPFNDALNHTFSISGTIDIIPAARGVDPDSTDRGQVVAMVQSKNRLLAKQTVVLGTDGSARSVPFNVSNLTFNGADPLYYTLLLYGDHNVSWFPRATYENQSVQYFPSTHVLAEPPLPGKAAAAPYGGRLTDPMSGGFHQWTYGVFNGSYTFDPDLIALQYTSTTDQTSAFFPTTPAVAGVPSNGDTTLAGSTGPVWRGRSQDDYIGPGFFHPSYSGSGVVLASPPPGSAFRRSQSTTTGFTANAFATVQSGGTDTWGEVDLLDLNGDLLPDLLGIDRAGRNRLASAGVADFESSAGLTLPFASFRLAESLSGRWGIGLGSIASQLVDKPSAKATTKMLVSTLPSFGLGYGVSLATLDTIDINGDGLVDLVVKDPGTGQATVRLGRGYLPGLTGAVASQPFQGTEQLWTMPKISPSLTEALSQASEVPFLLSDADYLRAQDNASNSLQINIMGIGGGVAYGASRSLIDMVDINGDGLPDRVMKRPALPGELHVQINTGLGFLAPEIWSTPTWQINGTAVPINSSGMGSIGLGTNDALGFTQSKDLAVSAGAVIPIPIVFVCLVLELSASSDTIDTNTQMSFQDINGDGYPDQVFKQNDITGGSTGTTVYAKLNPTGAANLLTHVEGPVGGSFDLEYTRAGNEVDVARHTDMQASRWVMSAVTVHSQPKNAAGLRTTWNADPSVRTEFKYADGFYSRADRDFVGFAKVTTTKIGEQSTVEETYDTSDVYHKGLLSRRVVRDSGSRIFDFQELQYETRVLQVAQAGDPRPAQWVVQRLHRTRSYEGGSTILDAATVTFEEARDYDNTLHELSTVEDRGDTSTSADDVKYTLEYFQDAAKNISKPKLIKAQDSAGAFISQRSSTYLANGLLKTVTRVLIGGRNPATGTTYAGPTDPAAATYLTANPTWSYGYDGAGNMNRVTDPVGYSITVLQFDGYAIHPTSMTDSFGYNWGQTFNVPLGVVATTTDLNGVKTTREFDAHQRINKVTTTSAGAGATAVERFNVTYQTNVDAINTPRAMMRYQNPERSQTLALSDGWGRMTQIKEKSVVDDGAGNPVAGLTLSGRKAFDTSGRLASVGQPVFRSGFNLDVELAFDPVAAKNPTTFQYDAMSRTTAVNHPGGRPATRTAYEIVSVAGIQRKRRSVTDSNGEITRSYLDARDRIISVEQRNTIAGVLRTLTSDYEYDAMGRLLRVFDPKENVTSMAWDTLGQLVTLTSLDTGVTRYDYDLGGNVGRKQNANGKTITYVRTRNRLDKVDYPDSTDVVYTYGANGATLNRAGRVASVTDETGVQTNEYDEFGNIRKTVWTPAPMTGQPTPPAYTTSYIWDAMFATLRAVTSGNETTTYEYDVDGRVNKITGVRGATLLTHAGKILYNEFGERTRLSLGNGAVTKYTYEATTRRLDTVQTDASSVAVQRLDYGYDFVGNVKTVVDSVPAPATTILPGTSVLPGPTSRTFSYDNLYQLTQADGTYTGIGSHGGRTYSLTMSYDELGNITRKNQLDRNKPTVGAAAQTQTATTHNVAYVYGGTRPHAATGIGSQVNTFDADGNPLTSMGSFGIGRTMTWNEEDRLKTITQAGVTTSFLYRPGSDRAIKRGSAETFYANPFVSERRGVSTTRHIMLGAERIASEITVGASTKTFFYHSDHLQSGNLMTDAGGTLLQHTQYLPFGETWTENIRNNDASNLTPYLFNGKEREETGLYYFGARYYDPVTAQWKNPDPALRAYVGGSPNQGLWNPANLGVYGYAFNNPLSVRDPSGRAPTTNAPPAPAASSSPPVVSIGEVYVVAKAKPVEAPPTNVSGDKHGQERIKAYVKANEPWVLKLADPYAREKLPVLAKGANSDDLRKIAHLELAAAERAGKHGNTLIPSIPEDKDLGAWTGKQIWKAIVRGATSIITQDLKRGPGGDLRGFDQADDIQMGMDYLKRADELRAAAATNFDRANDLDDAAEGL